MPTDFRQIRVLEAVARHGSITRAAQELHLTQPAVSMSVRHLEESLGLPLVERVGRRIVLTPVGQELADHARRIVQASADLDAAVEQIRGLDRGVLRLAVVSTANYFLAPILAAFRRLHPGIGVALHVANRDSVLAALEAGESDLAVTGQPPEDAELVAQRFKDNPLVVIAPPGHPLLAQAPIPVARLVEEPLVVREQGSGTRAAMERLFAAHGLAYEASCVFASNEAVKQAVQAGLGLGVISAQTIELELATGRLTVLPVETFPILRVWYLLYRAHRRLPPAAQAFRRILLGESPR
ncbi:MAG: LysR family transcriptional regulator [Geminicoccaceae bacterium]|nr:LysR family transcriptional regulator [Geminicoccaceae bacterium]